MRRFSEDWDVVFVEGLPMRSVTLGNGGEAGRVLAKLRASAGLRTVRPGLHVLRPLPVPPAGPAGRWLQRTLLGAQIARARSSLALGGPTVSWFSHPLAAPLLGRLGESGSIFYYQDRYDEFSNVDSDHIRQCVTRLANSCDVAVTTSEGLADDLRGLGASPTVIPHGVDVERFADERLPPVDLAPLERPLVGYVGLLDHYLAFDHLIAVADRLERGTLVLVGAANTNVSSLEAHPRIALLGSRPYESIPAYLAAFACCLVPFDESRLSQAVNPIKLREYLAAGRPTVSTSMPAVEPYGDVIHIAGGPRAFADAVMGELAGGADSEMRRAQRRARVADESWDAVAAEIDAVLRHLLPRP